MHCPEFTPDGGYSLIVRSDPVLFTQRTQPPKRASLNILFGESKMKALKMFFMSLFAFLLSAFGVAHAALDTTVTTAMGDGLIDVKALGALALIIAIAVAIFKKLRGAA